MADTIRCDLIIHQFLHEIHVKSVLYLQTS